MTDTPEVCGFDHPHPEHPCGRRTFTPDANGLIVTEITADGVVTQVQPVTTTGNQCQCRACGDEPCDLDDALSNSNTCIACDGTGQVTGDGQCDDCGGLGVVCDCGYYGASDGAE